MKPIKQLSPRNIKLVTASISNARAMGIFAWSVAMLVGTPAQASTWNNASTGGNWSDDTPTGWNGSGVPNSDTAIADFSTLDIAEANTVHLDGSYQVNSMLFGDLTTASNNWFLDNNTASVNILTLGGTTPTIEVSNQTANISAQISGTAGLTKTGTGTLVLSSASNDYTGGTVISRGITNVTGTLAASSDLSIGPATFSYQNNANLSLGTLRFTGGFSILENLNSGTSSLTFSGLAVSNGAIARVSDATGYDPVKFSADVSTNDLIPGLWWGDGRNLAALDSSTGNLRAMNYATDNGFVFAGGTEIGADNSGKNISLNTANVTAQPSISMKSLYLNYNNVARSLNLNDSAVLTIAGGVISCSNSQTAAFEIKGASGAVLDNNNTDLKVHTQRTNGNLAISIPIQGDGGLTYWGVSNEFWLSAANTFTGGTRLLTANTYLNNKLGLQNSTLNYALGDAGILDFRQVGSSASPNVLGGLSGSRSLNLLRSDRSGATLASNVVSIGNNGQSTTYSGVLSGTTASIIKTGTGTLTLTGANSYGGSTTISSGTLALSGTGSITNSSAIAVGTNATFDVSGVTEGWSLGAAQTLRGTGTLLGNATVNGIVAPGAPSGTLSASGNLAFAASSSLATEIDLAGTAQVESATAVGAPTADGSINVTVTAADIAGSPVLINVTVLATDTTDDWAGKVRTALAGNAAITAVYQVGGGGAAITLTRIIPAANDATLNIALASGSADPGITAAATSADTTVGAPPTGSDVLAVTGALDISAATLNLTASGLTAPAYVIATYGSRTGTFTAVNGLPDGYIIDYAYNSGTAIAVKLSTGDTTPPVWAEGWPLADTATSSGFSVHAKTNENGSAYYVVLANDASTPSAAQVKAGQDSAGAAAPSKGTLTLTVGTEAGSPVTGLASNTSYDVWFVAEDAVSNLQANPVKVDVATLASLSPFAEWIGGFSVGGLSGPGDDPDADGKPNFLEFALNSDPANAASQGKVFVKLATVGGTPNVLTLSVAVRSAAAAFAAEANNQKAVDATGSLTYLIEAANTLADWGSPLVTEVIDAGDLATIQAGLPAPDPGWSYHSFRTDGNTTTDPSDFIRVKVTSP